MRGRWIVTGLFAVAGLLLLLTILVLALFTGAPLFGDTPGEDQRQASGIYMTTFWVCLLAFIGCFFARRQLAKMLILLMIFVGGAILGTLLGMNVGMQSAGFHGMGDLMSQWASLGVIAPLPLVIIMTAVLGLWRWHIGRSVAQEGR
jgi:multisubunit Na+/H+ antiporter MnhC subunit